jgi:hypothetical protein
LSELFFPTRIRDGIRIIGRRRIFQESITWKNLKGGDVSRKGWKGLRKYYYHFMPPKSPERSEDGRAVLKGISKKLMEERDVKSSTFGLSFLANSF